MMSIMCDEIIFHYTPKNLLSNYLVIVEQRSCRENSIKTKENSRIYSNDQHGKKFSF